MKRLLNGFLLLSALAFGGCYSFETTRSKETGERHIIAMNYGWYLFNRLPIICGNSRPKAERFGPWSFFKDEVTFDNTQRCFMRDLAADPHDLHDLNYWVRENFLFEIPFVEIPLPIPYLITYREIQLSGVLK